MFTRQIYYIFATVRAPFMAFFCGVNGFDEQDHRGLRKGGDREGGSKAVVDDYMARNERQSLKIDTSGNTSQDKDGALSSRANPSRVSVASNSIDTNAEREGASIHGFQYEDASHADREFKDKLRATRLRRLREHEVMRPGQRARQVLKESDNAGNTTPEVHFDGDQKDS
ncbi:hypothetical protein FRB96_000535 [Tulasnella sp. 330]|nr:hypothetical protein FRB96_000535 [Tulasnella sp. 330]